MLVGPLSNGKSKVHVVRLPISSTTYYLIENRHPTGPDKNLPSYGLLVYFCDDEIEECRRGRSPVKIVNADPSVPQLKGAPFTLEGRNSYEDEKHHISVRIIGRKDDDYKILVSNDAEPVPQK